jgi:nitrate/nitrite transport system ATP-binding protein
MSHAADEDFNLVLKKGGFVSLIGHSGCGKSSVLAMTAGLNEISPGAITLDGTLLRAPIPNARWCSSLRTCSPG